MGKMEMHRSDSMDILLDNYFSLRVVTGGVDDKIR